MKFIDVVEFHISHWDVLYFPNTVRRRWMMFIKADDYHSGPIRVFWMYVRQTLAGGKRNGRLSSRWMDFHMGSQSSGLDVVSMDLGS